MSNSSIFRGATKAVAGIPKQDAIPQTMAELGQVIIRSDSIASGPRTEICNNLGRAFELLPALAQARPNGRVVGPMLKRLHPVTTNLSSKRLANIVSSVKTALRIGYASFPGAQHRTSLVGDWEALFKSLGPRSAMQMNLSRIVHWFQLQGIAPSEVTDICVKTYINYLADVAAVSKPINSARTAVRAWNAAAETITDWPNQVLTLPSSRKRTISPAIDELSASCYAGHAVYSAQMTTGTTGSSRKRFEVDESEGECESNEKEDKGCEAYATATRSQRERLIRRGIGLLASATDRPVTAVEWKELSIPKNAALILLTYEEELGGNTESPSLQLMAICLLALARHHFKVKGKVLRSFKVLLSDAAKPVRDFAKRNPGMTAKNRARLQRIGPAQLKALFCSPAVLIGTAIQRIRRGTATTSDLVDAQVGAGIAILLHAPIRGANLASIQIGVHLQFTEGDEGQAYLRFEAKDTKTGRPLEIKLPLDVTRLLKLFVSEVLPSFPRSRATHAMFAGLSNKTKGVSHLGQQIRDRVNNLTGLDMNQHLFRHFLAAIFLESNPGKYEVVQELLGHANVQTTKEHYCGLETAAAVKAVHDCIAQVKVGSGLDPNDMSKVAGGAMSGAKRKQNRNNVMNKVPYPSRDTQT